jgi:uncharacterized Zn finger protein
MCTCHKYFDKGVCKHLIAACMLNNISLPRMTELPKKFLLLRRRQTARFRDDSRSEETFETSEVVSTSEPVQDIEASVEAQQEKKRRGRKPKIQNQPIQSPIDKGGRPPLVRNALADDTAVVAPVLRRSNRNK